MATVFVTDSRFHTSVIFIDKATRQHTADLLGISQLTRGRDHKAFLALNYSNLL
jgi:hypothetical protein